MAEVQAKVLLGPFSCIADLPVASPSIAPRCGIWECHGNAVVPDVRNIDNLLLGGQNSTAGSTHSHRPPMSTLWQPRAAAWHACAQDTSYLGGQVISQRLISRSLETPTQIGDLVLAQYDPVQMQTAFFVPLSQVFGSKTSPVNFPVTRVVLHCGGPDLQAPRIALRRRRHHY